MKYYNYPAPRGTEVAENVDSKNISQYCGVVFVESTHQIKTIPVPTRQTRTSLDPGEGEVEIDSYFLDKTWQEIHDFIVAGKTVIIHRFDEEEGAIDEHFSLVIGTSAVTNPEENLYSISCARGLDIEAYNAYDPNGEIALQTY